MTDLFIRLPRRIENGVPFFGGERDGDWFDAFDVAEWQNGRFADNWCGEKLLHNPASRHLLDEIVAREPSLVELACGPGMGLLPAVRRMRPGFPCTATDACGTVLLEWQKYLADREDAAALDFAQFSLMDIPLAEDSVPAYSSFIGLSSTRNGEKGYDRAVAEVRRTLRPGGRLYAIENEWDDVPGILRLFERAGMQPWSCFLEPQQPWRERFEAAGLRVVHVQTYERHTLRANDNELGRLAERFGVQVGMNFTALIAEKECTYD